MDFKRLAREPLVHFLLAGALLYALFALSGGEEVDPASRVIEVDQEQQALLAVQFERTMGRAPTDAELDAAIERFVRDEVLYREALRLGLDQNDAVVRRRLVAKMDMTASAAAQTAAPDEAVLREFFESNRDRYAGETTISFDQVYFNSEPAARAAGEKFGEKWQTSGTDISLPKSMDRASSRAIEAQFGQQFSSAIVGLEAGQQWHGPIRSGYGWHKVRVREKDRMSASFTALKSRIENDWRNLQGDDRKQRAFAILRDAYRVKIDR